MTTLKVNMGLKVHCKDAGCGKVDKLVYDPFTNELSDMIVSEGLLVKTYRVVSISLVENSTPEGVFLSIEKRRFESLPKYREIEYQVIERQDDIQAGELTPASSLMRVNPYGIPAAQPYHPTVKQKVIKENVGQHEEILERGTAVVDLNNQKLGMLDHILLDQETCKISHIVVDRGKEAGAKVIPITMIETISHEHIMLHITEQDLDETTDYSRRSEEHILAEARSYLRDSIKADIVQFSIREGIIYLDGIVKDVLAKRKIESAARMTRGVVDVENNLRTDTAIQAGVTAALQADPRTELAPLSVESDYGVVTIHGVADSEEISKVAENIAGIQPGVGKVVNEIQVQSDEFSPYLVNRLGWETDKMKDLSYFPRK
jgi:hypothetical protein